MIYDTTLVESSYENVFAENLDRVIHNYQEQGLDVDVQYRPVSDRHLALVIARRAA